MDWFWNNGNLITLIGGIFIVFGSVVASLGVYATNKASGLKNQEISRLTEELNSYALGTDSFVWLEVEAFGTPDANVHVKHQGEYPVRDVEFIVFDISEQLQSARRDARPQEISTFHLSIGDHLADIDMPVIHPGWEKVLYKFPLEQSPTNDYYGYYINIYAHNDQHGQFLELQKVDGAWRQWIKVLRDPSGNSETRIEYFTP